MFVSRKVMQGLLGGALVAGASSVALAENARPIASDELSMSILNAAEARPALDALRGDGDCDPFGCYWQNGAADGVNGQSSEIDTQILVAETADDFYLLEGKVFKIDSISATFYSSSSFADNWQAGSFCLNLYYDCDGCPEHTPFFTTDAFEIDNIDESGAFANLGLATVEVSFNDLHLVLCGGQRLWVSIQNKGDGSWADRGFWATSRNGKVQGSEAKFRSNQDSYMLPDWTPISETNVGKTEFSFEVCAELCHIACDNGDPIEQGFPNGVDVGVPNAFAADQFQIVGCPEGDLVPLCYFIGYLITNCDPSRATVEIFDDADCYPNASLTQVPFGDPKIEVVAENISGPVSGLVLYRLTFDLDDLLVTAGCNYWAVFQGKGTGALNERAFWAYNDICGDPCDIKIAEGKFRSKGLTGSATEFFPISFQTGTPRDFAFKVAADLDVVLNPTQTAGGDVNGNGSFDVNDLYDVLKGLSAGSVKTLDSRR